MTNAVEVRHLSKSIEGSPILNDICMNVRQGEVYGFLGANGAGKTSLMKTLYHIIFPDTGTVCLLGETINKGNNPVFSRIGSIIEKATCETSLKKYVQQTVISGTEIQNEWFPEIDADIFISHSHIDEELACALAGWIYEEFKLTSFIDSNVWNYSNDLLEELNAKLSNRRRQEGGGYLYDYQRSNQVSQHVDAMLSIALQKMIDKVEAVIVLNTGNSIKVCNDTQMEETYSPWIYTEIVCTQIIRKKPLLAYRNYQFAHSTDRRLLLESGGIKAAKSRPPSVRTVAPGRAQNLLAGCIFVGVADKSAFALLSQKVTKAMRRIRRSLPDREKGKLIEADYQRYDRERICQP